MATQIYVNLPVKDLQRSMDFFAKLGYTFNPRFTDKNAACLVISDTIYAMLLVEEFFMSFTKKQIVDTKKASEIVIALSTESRAEVDKFIEKAKKAGALVAGPPAENDFMYSRAFEDLDGHNWEIMWMDPAHV